MTDKKWDGVFEKNINKTFYQMNKSINEDLYLYKYEIKLNKAYTKALCKAGLITETEQDKLLSSLEKLPENLSEIEYQSYEDIHMMVEDLLKKDLGDLGDKIHTGRSRNEQVVCDIALYTKHSVLEPLSTIIKSYIISVIKLSEKTIDIILPGQTHFKIAQPILLGHYFLSYIPAFERCLDKIELCFKHIDSCPIGSGALAGTGFNIDRKYIADKLNFKNITQNSIDAVTNRDQFIFAEYIFADIFTILSRLSEDFIIWNNENFNYITLDEAFSTGSSMMPQKKNPDFLELFRSYTSNAISLLMNGLINLKGLSTGYNKDLQEFKKQYILNIHDFMQKLELFTDFLESDIFFNKEKMYNDTVNSYANATELADYLTLKGIPFRQAHNITGKLVKYALKQKKYLYELTLEEYKTECDIIENDVFDYIKIENAVLHRSVPGGTARSSVVKYIETIKDKYLV